MNWMLKNKDHPLESQLLHPPPKLKHFGGMQKLTFRRGVGVFEGLFTRTNGRERRGFGIFGENGGY